MSYGLGLDLGTAFTAAAIHRADLTQMVRLRSHSVLLPSVVRVAPDGSLTTANTGGPEIAAHLFRRRLGDSTPIRLGGHDCTAGELLTALLVSALGRVTAKHGGTPPGHVVVTFPAVWGPYRREQFAEVTRRAGLARGQVTLLAEAEAVTAWHLGHRPPAGPEPIAVYDAGGSTFDATVIRTSPNSIGVLGVPESLEWFGGVDLDDAVMAHLDLASDGAVGLLDSGRPDDSAALRQVRDACVQAKETLSTARQVVVEAELPGTGHRPTLDRDQLEQWIRPQLTAGLPALRRVLDSAGVRAADLGAVLLTGGTARIPLVSAMLAEDLGRPVTVLADPQYSAALGAAALAGRIISGAGPGL
ncbi:Hsp70 family protein [Kineosporia mesophila]|uniref:Hsp70 family protein n=1 Tax=Kineosporia mesophila TaxID=566012 RepID=UPI001E28943A|nr:Hsp70 family protein [Kineosporia mesophila]MCD5348817.1 Hsp70 family protein [Kineosporia mesophila]